MLAHPPPDEDRERYTNAVLARAQFSAREWEEESSAWDAQLSRALELATEDGVPELIVRYSSAVQNAQARLTSKLLELSELTAILREMTRGRPLGTLLEQRGILLSCFLASQAHWTAVAGSDEVVRRAIQNALSRT